MLLNRGTRGTHRETAFSLKATTVRVQTGHPLRYPSICLGRCIVVASGFGCEDPFCRADGRRDTWRCTTMDDDATTMRCGQTGAAMTGDRQMISWKSALPSRRVPMSAVRRMLGHCGLLGDCPARARAVPHRDWDAWAWIGSHLTHPPSPARGVLGCATVAHTLRAIDPLRSRRCPVLCFSMVPA
jgi:hypothetical protein